MNVSLDWLRDYVDLPMTPAELADRLALAGLNHESFSDAVIDLEVTSNRPDCLGHLGVAREVGVLFGLPVRKPAAEAKAASKAAASSLTNVEIKAPKLCSRYTARVIRGVKVGPSPAWLANRLRAVGVAVINNVVDASNYVLMECGQPLHAFDFAKLRGGRIIVREAMPGEQFTAINHQSYDLAPGTCVIADGERPVALAGVMGGADTEVSEETSDLLIESAVFDPLSIRNTARRLNLRSDSSYRFERGVDPEGIDWASRRCCELILETAGGELAEGVVDVGAQSEPRQPIKLRFEQLVRVLGISVPEERVRKILTALGCEETHHCGHCIKTVAPSWRADLTREIDLVEEVARIHGYDKIPEDVGVRMAPSRHTREDRVHGRIREVMTAAGFYEAMTLSAVDEAVVETIHPWTSKPPLRTTTPVLRRADCLRQTLVPSLLAARRHNETLSNPTIELYEIANVYLPATDGLPVQRRMLGITSGSGFGEIKGVLETLVERLAPSQRLLAGEADYELLDAERQCRLTLGESMIGYLGEVSPAGRERFQLRGSATVAEIDCDVLASVAELIPLARPLSPYQPMSRDLNLVVDASVRWTDVERIARKVGGEELESLAYQETYWDAKRLGEGKKSLLFSMVLRSQRATMTGEEADGLRDNIVDSLRQQLGAELRA